MRPFLEKRLDRRTRPVKGDPRVRKLSQSSWLAILIVMVGAIFYTSPRFEVADHQIIQIPPRSFHGYPAILSKDNLIHLDIISLDGQPFDFYLLTTPDFDLLKEAIVHGKDSSREPVFIHEEQGVTEVKLHYYGLRVGEYTFVMDNTHYGSAGAESPLRLDFKVQRKVSGF
jgi:hypothetical protein